MLFGGIDWNQVLMQGLIGGAIGAVIGLVAYLFKKKDKKDADTGDGDDKPWRKKPD